MKFTPNRDGFLSNMRANGRGRVRTEDYEDLGAAVDTIRNAALELGLDTHEVQIRRGLHDGELFVQATRLPLPTEFQVGFANIYEPLPAFPCRARLDSSRLSVYVYPVHCELEFAHKGLHRHGWDHQWSEKHTTYPWFAMGRADQCPSWSGNQQCRLDAGHDPDAEFDAMIHAGGGARWGDPHTDDEWDAWDALHVLATVGQPEGTE